jgi:hypothetical protein
VDIPLQGSDISFVPFVLCRVQGNDKMGEPRFYTVAEIPRQK